VLRAGLGSVLHPVLIALLSLGAAVSRHLEQIGPMTAGLAIQATTGLGSQPISPWAGRALLLGGTLLRLRDA
jgi:hypothetical protein